MGQINVMASRYNVLRTHYHFQGVPVHTEFNRKQTSNKPKLRVIPQNNWPVF